MSAQSRRFPAPETNPLPRAIVRFAAPAPDDAQAQAEARQIMARLLLQVFGPATGGALNFEGAEQKELVAAN